MSFLEFCKELEEHIIQSYESSVTMSDAERLAGKFLHGQMRVSAELAKADLDSRMKKSGVKAIRAALYTEIRTKGDKQTEASITALLDSNELVSSEQTAFDNAEVYRDELERYYNIFASAHVYFRQISKGSMG